MIAPKALSNFEYHDCVPESISLSKEEVRLELSLDDVKYAVTFHDVKFMYASSVLVENLLQYILKYEVKEGDALGDYEDWILSWHQPYLGAGALKSMLSKTPRLFIVDISSAYGLDMFVICGSYSEARR